MNAKKLFVLIFLSVFCVLSTGCILIAGALLLDSESEKTFEIVFFVDDEPFEVNEDETFVQAVKNSAMPKIENKPQKEGYAFLGFFDENDVKYYNSDLSSARIWDKSENAKLYAKWSML